MIWFFWRRYLRNDEKRNISPLSGFMFLFEVFSEILDYDFAVTLEDPLSSFNHSRESLLIPAVIVWRQLENDGWRNVIASYST